jgi:hypothetical protein
MLSFSHISLGLMSQLMVIYRNQHILRKMLIGLLRSTVNCEYPGFQNLIKVTVALNLAITLAVSSSRPLKV